MKKSSFLCLLFLGACGFFNSFKTGDSPYHQRLRTYLKHDRLFIGGEQRLAIKALHATQAMQKEQSAISPGFEFKHNPERTQIIVAVSSQNRIPFSSNELKFFLNNKGSLGVEELTSPFQIQTLYPFAYPYYRVFVVDFEQVSGEEGFFEVWSTRGKLGVKLHFAP